MTGLEEVNGKGLFLISPKTKAEQQQVTSGGFTFRVKGRRSFCQVIQLRLEVHNVQWFIVAILHLHRISY